MDCGGHKLYIPGPGDIQIILPPGSKEIPLRKDCSGHLVMIVDDYERVVHKKGGVPEPPLQMRADSAGSSAGQPSSASGNANAETTQVAEIIRFQSADKDLVGRYYVLRLIGRGNRQIAQWEANFDDGDAGPRLSHRRVGDKFPRLHVARTLRAGAQVVGDGKRTSYLPSAASRREATARNGFPFMTRGQSGARPVSSGQRPQVTPGTLNSKLQQARSNSPRHPQLGKPW
jgi:hypothetical protein